MKFSLTIVPRYLPALLKVTLLVLPLGYGLLLCYSEWSLRGTLAAQTERSVPPATPTAPVVRLSPDAIATVMGLAAQNAEVRSAEPLTLRASFVSSSGLSRALLAGPEGERLYRVGDNLPGGSVLRRVEVSRVVLWRKGREESLLLQPSTERAVLVPGPTDRNRAPEPAFHFFRPSADLPQSH